MSVVCNLDNAANYFEKNSRKRDMSSASKLSEVPKIPVGVSSSSYTNDIHVY